MNKIRYAVFKSEIENTNETLGDVLYNDCEAVGRIIEYMASKNLKEYSFYAMNSGTSFFADKTNTLVYHNSENNYNNIIVEFKVHIVDDFSEEEARERFDGFDIEIFNAEDYGYGIEEN